MHYVNVIIIYSVWLPYNAKHIHEHEPFQVLHLRLSATVTHIVF